MPSRVGQQNRNAHLVGALKSIVSATDLAAKEADAADQSIQWAPIKALLKLNVVAMTALVLIAGQLQELLMMVASQLPETDDNESPTD